MIPNTNDKYTPKKIIYFLPRKITQRKLNMVENKDISFSEPF